MSPQLLEWLMQTVGGSSDHHVTTVVAWHGRLMVLAWAIAVPLAVLLARYFKVMPLQDWPNELDNKFWWRGHRFLNYLAMCMTFFGIVLVFRRSLYSGNLNQLHSGLGWCLVFLTGVQVLSGFLRGTKGGPTSPRLAKDGTILDLYGDHYYMSKRRVLFEWIHKVVGILVVVVAIITITLGLYLADAPRWMLLTLVTWWVGIFSLSIYLQFDGRCLDTYQAIWGIDPSLPGAKFKPIGWGIRRLHPNK